MFNTNMSAADYAALSNSNNGWGDGTMWIWLILILVLFSGGNWGNNSGVQDQYTLASDFATLQRQIDSTAVNTQNMVSTNADQLQRQITSIGSGLSSLGYDQLNQFNGINQNVASSTYDLSTQLNTIASNQQSCCCTTNNNITSGFADVNYNLATQECNTRQTVSDSAASVINNQNTNTRSILDAIQNMQTSAMQDKIASLQSDNTALRFAASQQAQNAYLIDQLKQYPVAAYTVPNPYTGNYSYTTCSGCN